MKIRLVSKNSIKIIEMTSEIKVVTAYKKIIITKKLKNICYSDYVMIVTSSDLNMNNTVCFNSLIIIEEDILHFINLSVSTELSQNMIDYLINKNEKIWSELSFKTVPPSSTEYGVMSAQYKQTLNIIKFLKRQLRISLIKHPIKWNSLLKRKKSEK